MGRLFSISVSLLAFAAVSSQAARAQQLSDCAQQYGPSALCGWYEVAEDRSDPTGRKIKLRIVVLPAATDSNAEPVVMFPGGPGQAASDLIPLARQVYGSVRESRDFVFIGQRGTGESNPLNCTLDVVSDPAIAFGQVFSPARIRACHQATLAHANPALYTTREYVEDIDDALTALGYGRAILWGGSGGTRTAQAFLREHPHRVVAVAMDGVTPIDYAMPLPFSRMAQRAWERIVADCAAQAQCAQHYPGLDGDFATILRRLDGSSVSSTIHRPDGSTHTVQMARGDFAYALRGILYNAGASARLPLEVSHAATSGDLSFFAQSLFDRSVALRGNVIAMGVHLSAYCAEDIPRVEEGTVESLTSGTFIGTYLLHEYRAACEAWPGAELEDDWFRPVRSDVPVLLLSGYYDPSTPDAAADRVAQTLPNSLHIVVRNGGHGAGFGCAQPAVVRFLTTGSLEGVESPCPDTPIRFEVGTGG